MAKSKLKPVTRAQWDRPLVLFFIVCVTAILSWGERDLAFLMVLALGFGIAIYLVVLEQLRVARGRRQMKRFQDLSNSAVHVRTRELAKRIASEEQIAIATYRGYPFVARLSDIPARKQISIELASLVPESCANDEVVVHEASLGFLLSELELRIIESPKVRTHIESVHYSPFSAPLRVREREIFEDALVAARKQSIQGQKLRQPWRIALRTVIVGACVLMASVPGALGPNRDPWAYLFVVLGIALLGFSLRFGVSAHDSLVRYCNGLRSSAWKTIEIDHVAIKFHETFGFLGDRGGFHPVLILKSGTEIDLKLFAYSRVDSVRAYLQIERELGLDAAQGKRPHELVANDFWMDLH